MPPTTMATNNNIDLTIALHGREGDRCDEQGGASAVRSYYTSVLYILFRNIRIGDRAAMRRSVMEGLSQYDEEDTGLRLLDYFANQKHVPLNLTGEMVELLNNPRKGVPVGECIISSLEEMHRNGNSVRWGLLFTNSSKGSLWAVFHAVNYDRKHKVYYETEDRRSQGEPFERGRSKGVFFPFNLTDAFYKKVYDTWRQKRRNDLADLSTPYRTDIIMLAEGNKFHVMIERGGYAEDGGQVLGEFTYYGKMWREDGKFIWEQDKDAATGEWVLLD